VNASFRIVRKSASFDSIAAQGCASFLRYYFSPFPLDIKEASISLCKEVIRREGKDLLIRPRFDLAEQANVISKLFDDKIPISLDEFSGSLRIGYATVK
jgi:hypothetical protein